MNILQVFTIDFSEIQFIVNHNSQSDGQNKSAKRWDELTQEDHTYRLTPEEFRENTKDNGILLWTKQAKIEPMKLRSDFRVCCLDQKNRLHHESGEQVEEPIPCRINTVDGILLQAHRGGTSLNGIGSELIRFFYSDLLFVTVGFVYSRWRSTVTDGWCRQIHHTYFYSCALHIDHTHIVIHGVSGAHSFHPHAIHDVTFLRLRLLSLRVCLSPIYLSQPFPFTIYLFSVRHINFHNVVTAEG